MDIVLVIDTVINLLAAICASLAALAVIFLVVRPLLDPHWRDARIDMADDRESSGDQRPRDPDTEARSRGMLGT